MAEHNYLIEEDLREAEAMTRGLENYLAGNELYGSVGGGFFTMGNMPSLTVGALVMRLRRLGILREQMNAEQATRYETVVHQHRDIRQEHLQQYEAKLLREANSRLDAMRAYFQETAERPSMAASTYKPELLRRTIVQEIMGAMGELGITSSELKSKAGQIDGRLHTIANQPDGFQWDRTLEPAYPKAEYWWLYHRPRER